MKTKRTIHAICLFLILGALAGTPAVQAQAPSGEGPTPAAPTSDPWIANQRVNDINGGDQEDPAIAIGGDGVQYVLWTNGTNEVRLSYIAPDGDWNDSEWVADSGQASDIAADGDGNVYILWKTDTSLDFATRTVSGTWTEESIGPSTSVSALGADDAGNVQAAWLANGPSVVARHRAAGGGWGGAATVWTAGSDTAIWDMDLAVTAEGDAYLVWLTFEGAVGAPVYGRVYGAYRPAGGAWGGATQIDEVPLHTGLGFGWLAADAAGSHAHVAWSMYDFLLDGGSVYQPVQYARGSGAGWSTPETIPGTPLPEDHLRTNLAVGAGGQGEAQVCWSVAQSWEPIRCALRGQSGSWGAVTIASDGVAGHRFEPHLATRGATTHLVWTDNRRGDYDVYYTRLPTPHLRTSSTYYLPADVFVPGHDQLVYTVPDQDGNGNCLNEAV
ncbi:MAG TPA: hypothetical protein ENJ31_03985, partial [Anaerolineae bacterium]|nr:hypothetical protein [Anaerolineae bacterium]